MSRWGKRTVAWPTGSNEPTATGGLPAGLEPELATLVSSVPARPGEWLFEIKFDGYRLLPRIEGGRARIFTRQGHDWTDRVPYLAAELEDLGFPDGWYDGEAVVLDEHGRTNFNRLQNAFDTLHTQDIVLYLFDAPYLAGLDIRDWPCIERRAALQEVMERQGQEARFLRFSEAFDAPPHSLVASACQMGLEGIIGKRADSPYRHRRSDDWIKLKCGHRQEFVIGGWTPSTSGRHFGSLLLGVYEAGMLRYAGSVGTGWDMRTVRSVQAQLDPLAAGTMPFAAQDRAAIDKVARWVRPELVCEVYFGEWTPEGKVRHASFRGLRTDKPASEVVREEARTSSEAPAIRQQRARVPAAVPLAKGGTTAQVIPTPRLKVTNPERVIDPSTGITKADLVRYYALVAPLLMEHVKGRPISVVRAPTGLGGQQFFQTHLEDIEIPGWRRLDPDLRPGHQALIEMTVQAGAPAAAQFGVVELHTWNAVKTNFQKPDRIVFDIDPGEGVSWAQIQQAASLVRVMLQELGLTPFLKTSGAKGLHLVVPIKRQHGWDTVSGFAKAVVQHLAATIPQLFVAKSGPSNRVGKIFVDYLRNGWGATTAAAWSARARPGIGVSVPVRWEELDILTSGAHWTVQSVLNRTGTGNVPWAGYSAAACSLSPAMDALGYTAKKNARRLGRANGMESQVPLERGDRILAPLRPLCCRKISQS